MVMFCPHVEPLCEQMWRVIYETNFVSESGFAKKMAALPVELQAHLHAVCIKFITFGVCVV